MKDGGTGPVGGAAAARATARAAGEAPGQAVARVATAAGIAAAELTPPVRAAIEMLTAELRRMREELHQAQQRVAQLEKLADEDALVPVSNRRAFARELDRMIAYAERYGVESSVLYFDVDGMKAINDTHGHAAGDRVLRRVGEVLARNVRKSDVVGRLGGDEFGVVLARAGAGAAHEKAVSLAAAIAAEPVAVDGTALSVRVSHGVYTFAGRAGDALDMADRAMYGHTHARPRR